MNTRTLKYGCLALAVWAVGCSGQVESGPQTTTAHEALSSTSRTPNSLPPGGHYRTPTPTVSVNYAGHINKVERGFVDRGAQLIRDWYPYVADTLTDPGLNVPSYINITLVDGMSAPATTGGSELHVDAAYALLHPDDLGLFIHEMTHTIQGYSQTPGFVTEGVADWARFYLYGDQHKTMPDATDSWENGYSPMAYLLEWIRFHKNPSFVYSLNNLCKMGRYVPSIFNTYAGASVDTLWRQMMVERNVAFVANTTELWVTDGTNSHSFGLGAAPGTSPSAAVMVDGGYVVAFQANTGALWITGTGGTQNLGLGMKPGTSPSVTALKTGGYEIAFQSNNGSLWTVGSAGWRNWNLGMRTGSSPAIVGLSQGGFQVAFQSDVGQLWVVGGAGDANLQLGMRDYSSPAITALPNNRWEVAFQSDRGELWTVGGAGDNNWHLGMGSGTSPSITTLNTGGFEVAFTSDVGNLWTVGNSLDQDWGPIVQPHTSPSIRMRMGGDFDTFYQGRNTGVRSAGPGEGVRALPLGMSAGTGPVGF